MPRTLSTTTDRATAGWCGYDGPCDPLEDGYSYTLTQDGDEFTLLGPNGELRLSRLEAEFITEALVDALRFAKAVA